MDSQRRAARRTRGGAWRAVRSAARIAALALVVRGGAAQIYISQDGRLHDANRQIGYGGVNPSRPVSPLLSGNAFATGNVGRGMSLRLDSPVGSPYAFGTTLGSGALSNFRRDSVSVADAAAPYGGLLPRVYYDPSQTVFTPRYLGPQQLPTPSGLVPDSGGLAPVGTNALLLQPWARRPTGSAPPGGGTPEPVDLRIGQSEAARTSLTSQIQGWSPSVPSALDSAIFGPQRPSLPVGFERYPLPSVTGGLSGGVLGGAAPRLRDEGEAPEPSRLAGSEPLSGARVEPLGTPLDLLIRGASPNTLLDPQLRGGVSGPASPPGLPGLAAERQKLAAETGRERAGSGAGALAAPLGLPTLPGLDVFTDIQLAMGLSREPGSPWFGEMQSVIRANPTLAGQMQELLEMDASRFSQRVLSQPIRTFAGRGDSALNETLARAELLLRDREYFGAVSQYERARMIDPMNPLPLLGKGHASLAAGDYLTALHNILAGLQRYPEMIKLSVDLKSFMGGEAIDIRRADLMQQLERREDPRLRFLLGYLEYYGGNRESGLSNLQRAAEGAPVGSFIREFPGLLTGERSLPPPRLPLSSFFDRPKAGEGESALREGLPATEGAGGAGERKEP